MEVHVEIAAEKLFNVGPVPITNSMLTMFAVMALIILVGAWIARKAQMVPNRKQGMAELIVEFLLGLVENTAGKSAGRRIFPLVAGIFIFIALANYTGLLPGVGTIGYYKTEEEEHAALTTDVASLTIQEEEDHESTPATGTAGEEHTDEAVHEEEHKVLVPFVRAPNADLNMTLAMALLTFTVVQFAGVSAHGVIGRIKHMADPPFLFPIEVVSELARIVSLSARLFGNVFAGEVLLGVMYAMAEAIKIVILPLAIPVIFLGLELLFGTIQALVFALLTLIYITLATAGGHGDHEHDEAHHPVTEASTAPAGAGD